MKPSKYVGYEQLRAIIKEILDEYDYPDFDLVNGVLSCKRVFGEINLWFWFGKLYIVKPGQTRAGDMNVLEEWNTEEDGTMTLIPGKKGDDLE